MNEKQYQKDAAASPRAVRFILVLLVAWMLLLGVGVFQSSTSSWKKIVLLLAPAILFVLVWLVLSYRRSRAQKKPH